MTTGLKVFSRRALCGTIARCLAAAALALAPLAAEATELDLLLTQNPALGRIAAADPAKVRRLLDAINQVLRRPEPLRTRSPFDLSAEDEALLAENPLLGQAFAHDPAAAVGLLKRVKAAGGRQ